MSVLAPVLFLALALAGPGPELDCSSPAAGRSLVGRMMLSEIEGAEDINRAALWEAFGRCPEGSAHGPCMAREERSAEAEWEREKAAIQAKYQRILDEFEARCRTLPI